MPLYLLISNDNLIQFGIILYILIWFFLACYMTIYSRQKDADVHEVKKLYRITVIFRYTGWLGTGIVSNILISILPQIYIVSRNTTGKEFYIESYYVPFRYKDRACKAYNTYLINESDSSLVLYATQFLNGMFTGVSDINEFEIIKPGVFRLFNRDINNKFHCPCESIYYVPDSMKNKNITEWTIALMPDALRDTEKIRNIIKERNEMLLLSAEEFVLRQLKKRYDAEQETY
ncbi:MAG: hypothetical protein NC115_01475 [Bacteroidales bacterium]|nr:hypothetical protein [Bacteroidales bacterium]